MLLVLWVNFDLIVPWEAIHKRHSLKATCIVNHDVSDGQWELVFKACCIAITIVNTDPNFSILFKNGDNISNLIWMLLLPYESTCDELMDFSFNSFHNVRTKPSLFLFHWLDVRLNIQTMNGYLRIKTRHIFIISCKDIVILSYECYQFFYLCKW